MSPVHAVYRSETRSLAAGLPSFWPRDRKWEAAERSSETPAALRSGL